MSNPFQSALFACVEPDENCDCAIHRYLSGERSEMVLETLMIHLDSELAKAEQLVAELQETVVFDLEPSAN